MTPANPSGAPGASHPSVSPQHRLAHCQSAVRDHGRMIQYKHASAAASKVMPVPAARDSAPRLTELRLGQMEDVRLSANRQTGAGLSGPAAPSEPGSRWRRGRASAISRNDRRSWTPSILLANTARTLHVGILADCFFDPADRRLPPSRNRRRPNRADDLPLQAQPLPQRLHRSHHRPAWTQAEDNARALLKEKRLSELQRTALVQELRRIETVLSNVADQAPHQANAPD